MVPWDPNLRVSSGDSHEVVAAIVNSTDFIFERVGANEHHGHFFENKMERSGTFVKPPQFIQPGETIYICGIAAMKTMNIELDVTYKKHTDDKDLFKLYFWVPYTGKNNYGDTGLRDWAKREFYIREGGDFRWNVSGSDSRKIKAFFDVGYQPYRYSSVPVKLQGFCQDVPAAASLDGKLYLVWQGLHNNLIWYSIGTEGENNSWSWTQEQMCRNNGKEGQEMRIKGSPCLVAWNGKIYLFHQGRDNEILWWNTFEPGKGWGQSQPYTTVRLTDSPTAVVYNNQIHLLHQGGNSDGTMWHITFDGNNWSQYKKLDVHRCSASPSLVVYNNTLSVFYQGQGNKGELYSGKYINGSWPGPAEKIEDVGMSASPSAVNPAGSKALFVFHQAHAGQPGLFVSRYFDKYWRGDTQLGDSELTLGPKVTAIGKKICLFHQGGPRGRNQIWFKIMTVY